MHFKFNRSRPYLNDAPGSATVIVLKIFPFLGAGSEIFVAALGIG
jgi:hypothetical protein